jgi:hypothetical protein
MASTPSDPREDPTQPSIQLPDDPSGRPRRVNVDRSERATERMPVVQVPNVVETEGPPRKGKDPRRE